MLKFKDQKLIPTQSIVIYMYILHKTRFCKFPKLEKSKFCSYHQENEEIYVKCPLDGTHIVAKNKLKKHLEICNITQNKYN